LFQNRPAAVYFVVDMNQTIDKKMRKALTVLSINDCLHRKNIYLMEKCFHYMPLISFVHVYIDMSFF